VWCFIGAVNADDPIVLVHIADRQAEVNSHRKSAMCYTAARGGDDYRMSQLL